MKTRLPAPHEGTVVRFTFTAPDGTVYKYAGIYIKQEWWLTGRVPDTYDTRVSHKGFRRLVSREDVSEVAFGIKWAELDLFIKKAKS